MDDSFAVADAAGHPITPAVLMAAYHTRCFPMARGRDGSIEWYRPQKRAVILWDDWHCPRSLIKRWRRQPYRLSLDAAFPDVIEACADRRDTWISHDLQALYCAMHRLGLGHSCEAWDEHGHLVGGLYGLAVGGCFCGESMFHIAPDAAKLCVMYLVHLLRRNGFSLLDCQQQTSHMQRFGAREISDHAYAEILASCRNSKCVLEASTSPSPDWY